MANILKDIAQLDDNIDDISLKDLETSFDGFVTDEKSMNTLIKQLEKNFKKEKYEFNVEDIQKQIMSNLKKISFEDIPENTIKVYQLCQVLKGENINIDGKIGNSMADALIDERIDVYKENGLELFDRENLSYKDTKLSINTLFGAVEVPYDNQNKAELFQIVNTQQSLIEFIDKKRSVLFEGFLKTKGIVGDDTEFTKELNEKSEKTTESIFYDDGNVYIDFKDENIQNINKLYYYKIRDNDQQDNILEFIKDTRETHIKFVEDSLNFQEFLEESNQEILANYNDPYNNIKLILGEEPFKEFKLQKFQLNSILQNNLEKLEINAEGFLVIEETPILTYKFDALSDDNKVLVTNNLSHIFNEFITLFPNDTNRLNAGTIDDIKNNINYEKKVYELLAELSSPANIKLLKDGQLNLSAWESKPGAIYLKKAFNYLIANLATQGMDLKEITKGWNINNSTTFIFMKSKLNSKDTWEQLYGSFYYETIKNKLGNILKINDNNEWALDQSKLNFSPDKNYQWLIMEISNIEDNTKIINIIKSIIKSNNLLKNLTEEQKVILFDTEIGFNMLKQAAFDLEQTKYESLTSTYETSQNKNIQSLQDVQYNIRQMESIIKDPSRYMSYMSNGKVSIDYNSIPYKYRRYLTTDKSLLNEGKLIIRTDRAKRDLSAEMTPINEAWVSHMLDIHKYGLTKYYQRDAGNGTVVRVDNAIDQKKKFTSPYSDKYCSQIIDFSYNSPNEIVRDTNWDGVVDWGTKQRDSIKKDPFTGIAKTVVDVGAIVSGGVVATIVTPIAGPQRGGAAFFLVDNVVKAGGYGVLESVNYLRGNEYTMGNYDNFFEALGYGASAGLGILEMETNQYLETSYKKNSTGNLEFKSAGTIIKEKALELGAALILFGPIGKVGHVVEAKVFNKMIINSSIKSFGEKTVTKAFGTGIMGAKTASKSLGFLAEVGAFTGFNTVYAPFSAGVMAFNPLELNFSAARGAFSQSWEEAVSSVGLVTNFIHNVGFIGLLKGANFMAGPMTRKVVIKAEQMRYESLTKKGVELGEKLLIEMNKKGVDFITPEKMAEFKAKGIKFHGGEKDGGFFQRTKDGYKYVSQKEIPEIYELNNSISELRGKVMLLTQQIGARLEGLNNIKEIREYNEFVDANNLRGMDVSPEIILEGQIKHCRNLIEKSSGENKTKYQNVLKNLQANKIKLLSLKDGYDNAWQYIKISDGNIEYNRPEIEVAKNGTHNAETNRPIQIKETISKPNQKEQLELEIRKLEVQQKQLEAERASIIGEKPRENISSIDQINTIISKDNMVSIGGEKHMYLGIKNGKMRFLSNQSRNKSRNIREFSSLKELSDAKVNFELKNTPKINGEGKNAVFNRLLEVEVSTKKPGDIGKKINDLKLERSRLEKEISDIESNNNNTRNNQYFNENKGELIGKDFWRDGKKYRISKQTEDGGLSIKSVDGKESYTIHSFNQLSEKGGIQFFAEQGAKHGARELTRNEKQLQDHRSQLLEGEQTYMSERYKTLESKKQQLNNLNNQIIEKNLEYQKVLERQKLIESRADKLEDVNKRLSKIDNELKMTKEKLEKDYPQQQNPDILSESQIEKAETAQKTPTEDGMLETFDTQIMSENGITVEGVNYKLIYEPNMTQNQSKKGTWKWIVDGKTINSAKAETKVLPENSNGNKIRANYNEIRNKYLGVEVEANKPSAIESTKVTNVTNTGKVYTVEDGLRFAESFPKKNQTDPLDLTINQALKIAGNRHVMVERGLVYLINGQLTTSQKIEVRLPDGAKEIGARKNGKLDGEGTRISKRNDIYKGKFKNGEFVEGELTRISGMTYKGVFKNGRIRNGSLIGKDGSVIENYSKGYINPIQKQSKPVQKQPKPEQEQSKPVQEQSRSVQEQSKIETNTGFKSEFNQNMNEGLEIRVGRALTKAGLYKNVVVENGVVYLIDGKLTTSQKIEVRLPDGAKEIGARKNGKLDGEGTRISKDGVERIGTWEEGDMKQGRINYRNGDRCEGEFKNNKLDGNGKYIRDGIVSEGIFRDWFLIEGKVTSSTEIHEGTFKLGKLETGTVKDKNGNLIKEYKNGKDLSQIDYENINSFETLYGELDRVKQLTIEQTNIWGKKTKTTYTNEEVKNMIEKGKTKYLPKEMQDKVNHLNKLTFNMSKASPLAKVFIQEFGRPKNIIEVSDGAVIHVTDVLEVEGGYKFVVGYALHKGSLEPRLFYRSKSEGFRRACPGARLNGGYSKAEFLQNFSYETTTKVVPEVGAKFDGFSSEKISTDVISFSKKSAGNDFLKEQMTLSVKISTKMFNEYGNSAVDFYQGRSGQDVINDYNKLVPKGLDYENMVIVKGKEYSYKHDFLGDVNVTVCRTKFNGENIDIHFSSATINLPNEIWIENIVYSDAKINSFGVYDRQINAGPLVAKPLDYDVQAPKQFHKLQRQNGGIEYFDPAYTYKTGRRHDYIDIRQLYQGNPIIQHAKNIVLSQKVNI